MAEKQEAMRDKDGVPVFVGDYGTYSYTFPRSNIVDNSETDQVEYKVYYFLDDGDDYIEKEKKGMSEIEAINYATKVYGSHIDGREVFEVEVHKVDK